jgi:flagellar hook protein FlgE
MGFQQGLSGLSAASKQLEVIGNNVANSSTVGFKQSRTQFSDVFSASLNGVTGTSPGVGVKVSEISQQFTQGAITASSNPLDLAINGSGFFRMSTNGAITYTRNGQFQLDKLGNVVNSSGAHLTGYKADVNGNLSVGAPGDININTAATKPQQTTTVGAVLNLDSRDTTLPTGSFNMNDPTTYNNSSTVSVYDSLGNAHALQTYYVKTATGEWDVYASADNAPVGSVPPAAAVPVGKVAFNNDGAIDSAASVLPLTAAVGSPSFNVKIDLTGSTQFGSNFGVTTLVQNGNTSGSLTSFSVGPDGSVSGNYSNGRTSILGQVALAGFKNPNGLELQGNNEWVETASSGVALVGPPSTGSLGAIQSSAVEESNVDLTSELVNMITAQRAYQANAQTIKTEDQVMQTLVNLK